jgi:hypothetical protein
VARARSLKPSLFKNEILGEADPLLTIVFQGLWCLADREGRLEDRPKRIKAEILPYRECPDFNRYLTDLERLDFITRYEVENTPLIQVINFKKHQSPHKTERPSELPPPPSESIGCRTPEQAPLSNGDATVKESLTPDSCLLTPGEERVNAPAGPPPCPQQAIVAAYHDELPTLPRVRVVSDTTAAALRKRWREEPERQTLEWWRAYFAYVRESCPFLVGNCEPGPNRNAPFQADFSWLVGPKNFEKVVNGRYDEGKARVG